MLSAVGNSPVLVLNADYRPLSYFPLSLWSWQDTVKAVFLDRVNVLSEYEHKIRSPSFEMRLPSVIALKEFVLQSRRPAFTRFNVFLRDRFSCQYCAQQFRPEALTFDHLIPKSRGGKTTWENVVTACSKCNLRKGNFLPLLSKCIRLIPRGLQHPSNFRNVVACFHPIICMKAGEIFSTGILS